MWFRRDLRVDDNPALAAAQKFAKHVVSPRRETERGGGGSFAPPPLAAPPLPAPPLAFDAWARPTIRALTGGPVGRAARAFCWCSPRAASRGDCVRVAFSTSPLSPPPSLPHPPKHTTGPPLHLGPRRRGTVPTRAMLPLVGQAHRRPLRRPASRPRRRPPRRPPRRRFRPRFTASRRRVRRLGRLFQPPLRPHLARARPRSQGGPSRCRRRCAHHERRFVVRAVGGVGSSYRAALHPFRRFLGGGASDAATARLPAGRAPPTSSRLARRFASSSARPGPRDGGRLVLLPRAGGDGRAVGASLATRA